MSVPVQSLGHDKTPVAGISFVAPPRADEVTAKIMVREETIEVPF